MIYSPGPGKYSPGPGQYSPGPELVSWVINSTGRPAGRRPLARQIWPGPGPKVSDLAMRSCGRHPTVSKSRY